MNGELQTWDIEDLREVERKGTSSVTSANWFFPSGAQYKDIWQVILSGKQMSPVRNRNERGAHYQLTPGDLGSFWVGSFGVGKVGRRSPTRRTDLMPFRVPGGTIDPPPPPPDDPPPDLTMDDATFQGYLDRTIVNLKLI